MDISSVSAILSSIKTATDIAKIIKSSDTSLEKAEVKLKLAELISALADAKIQVSEIQDEILQRESTIRSLHEQLATREKLAWEPPYYWIVENGQKDGPFCQHCYDKEKRNYSAKNCLTRFLGVF
jgi:hypothetical protein